jgi:hypothetical protein
MRPTVVQGHREEVGPTRDKIAPELDHGVFDQDSFGLDTGQPWIPLRSIQTTR